MARPYSRTLAIAFTALVASLAGCDDGGSSGGSSGYGSGGSSGGDGGAKGRIKIAFLTNNPSDFWNIAKAGVNKATAELKNVDCEFLMPPDGTAADQKRMIEALIAKGVTGLAISPNDPANQKEIINKACEVMNVICHDSDAPDTNRLCYVGTNNYKAGRAAGKLIMKVVPDGGKVMLFVGRIDAQNAMERQAGIIDELQGKPVPEKINITTGKTGEVDCGKWTILDTRTDLTDRARAKQNVEDTLTRYGDVACLVGLWSYNGPAILSAAKDAEKVGKVKIVTFDEEEDTLQGVVDGHIAATVVQQPYEFGYQSVKVLAALAGGDKSVVPANKVVDVPVMVIDSTKVEDFWANLKKLKSGK